MTEKRDLDAILIQAKFCENLMMRLLEEIRTSKEGWSGMENYTRK